MCSSDWTCARPVDRTPVKSTKASRATGTLKPAPAARPTGKYVLRLFVAGATERSLQAILRVQQLCAAELDGGCKLEVVDIYQQPKLARANQIVATPTLIMEFPRPVRRFIGNLASISGLSVKLGLDPAANLAV
jgi:circadian clock protein KaiB